MLYHLQIKSTTSGTRSKWAEATAESDSPTLTPCNRMLPIQIRKEILGLQETVDVFISDRVVTQIIHVSHAHIKSRYAMLTHF